MKYKADWPEARERLTALWEGTATDRPCIAVVVPGVIPDTEEHGAPGPPKDAMAQWLDPEWVVPNALSSIRTAWWGGEAIPSSLLMGGWVVSLGGKPRFDPGTIWFEPFAVDFEKPHPFHLEPSDPWVQRYERLYLAMAAAAGKDDFLLGAPGGLPVNDLLSMHLGTEEFLLALMEHQAWIHQAIADGARELFQFRQQLVRRVAEKHDYCYGNAGWMPFWAPEPYISMQSDVSCMLSPAHFEEFVQPELDLWGNAVGAMWYHLDGGDAMQHLPRLLSLPYMRVIQYVPRPCEPPNGEGHLALYREIQRAGRIVHIQVSADQVEPLCRQLDPRLLMLDASWSCKNQQEGRELLAAATRWTAAGCRPA